MLYRGQRVQAKAIADMFGVSRRTIERDLRVLQEVLGTEPVKVEHEELGVAYQLPYTTRQWKITPWQILAIAVGARLTGFLSGQHFATEVEPLLDQFRRSLSRGERMRLQRLERKIHVVATGQKDYRGNPVLQELLASLLEGLLVERPVSLSYLSHHRRGKGGQPRPMVVHPLSLTIHRGAVYFVVDVLEGAARPEGTRILLALDRITEASLTEDAQKMDYPADFDPRAFFNEAFGIMADGATFDVVIRVSAMMAPYVLERFWHSTQHLVTEDCGDLVVSMRVTGLVEISEWILGMGEHAEAFEPAELRSLVQERLEKALARYV